MSSQNIRSQQAQLYEAFISRVQNCPRSLAKFIAGIEPCLLNQPLTLTVTLNCSCGRFFEQHPTAIEDTDEGRLEEFVQLYTTGFCKCLKAEAHDQSTRTSSKTWLHVAAALGCQDMLEILVSQAKLDINTATSLYCFTPLALAVMQTKGTLVSWLCHQPKVDVNVKSKSEKHTPLIDAMLGEKFHLVEILTCAPGVDVNTKNFRGETPLVIAVRMNNAKLVGILLKAGADYSIPTADGVLPLLLSINSGHLVVREFVNAKVPLDVLDKNGDSALTKSLRNRYLDIVDLLIWGGADPRASPAFPALVLAANLGHVRTLVYLLDIGEEPDQTDDQGWTALHYACVRGYAMVVEILLDRGADPNTVTPCHNTALSLAIYHRHQVISQLLLAYGCDVNTFDLDLDTALHFAAINGDTDMVRCLLDHGACACPLNRVGATPLFNAVISGKLEVIKLLLPHYTDLLLHSDSHGFTYAQYSSKTELQYTSPRSLLWVAASNNDLSVIDLLLRAGFKATLEQWIHARDFPPSLEADDMMPVRELLIDSASNPSSLISLCRCVVRRALGPGRQRQVNQLNTIPRKVKNYISLREL